MKGLEQKDTLRPSDHNVTAYLVQDSPEGVLAMGGDKARKAFPRMGKWIVFAGNLSFADYIWDKVSKATRSGHLGVFAKSSTAKPDPKYGDRHNPKTRVIQVYTRDYLDEADMERVRQSLFAMGVTRRIPYKRQQDSDDGKYYRQGQPIAVAVR